MCIGDIKKMGRRYVTCHSSTNPGTLISTVAGDGSPESPQAPHLRVSSRAPNVQRPTEAEEFKASTWPDLLVLCPLNGVVQSGNG